MAIDVKTKKAARAVTIIGGADGPTSVFLVGKGQREKNPLRRIQQAVRSGRAKWRRRLAEKKITAGAHSLEETICYIREKYGAVEADTGYRRYEERKNQMKYSLIQREKPELTGGERKIIPPEDLQDRKAVEAWLQEVEEWTAECERKAAALPEEAFPIDYHLYLIDRGQDGKMEIETESRRGLFSVSYSGNGKTMDRIERDIYLFYGVSREDIAGKTERYWALVHILSEL